MKTEVCFKLLATTYVAQRYGERIVVYYFKYNQQDATLYNIFYYCQRSTCFRRFFRPSSGAQKLYTHTHSIWYMSSLLAATASGLWGSFQYC